jgi:hypothetical protein
MQKRKRSTASRCVMGSPGLASPAQVPFAITGKIQKITLTIERPKLTPEDEKKLMEAQRNNKASE